MSPLAAHPFVTPQQSVVYSCGGVGSSLFLVLSPSVGPSVHWSPKLSAQKQLSIYEAGFCYEGQVFLRLCACANFPKPCA